MREMKAFQFLEPDNFPVIGDVSPDPALAAVVPDALRLLELFDSEGFAQERNLPPDRPNSDFIFLASGKWRCVVHNRGSSKHLQHSHNDAGSPILSFSGRQVLTDLGRLDYRRNGEGSVYPLTSFHNVPQISNMDQNPRHMRDLYPDEFLTPTFNLSVNENGDHAESAAINTTCLEQILELDLYLFPHILCGGSWQRRLYSSTARNNVFVIEDNVMQGNAEEVTFRFFVPEHILKSGDFSFSFELDKTIVKPKIFEAIRNVTYGEPLKAFGIEVASPRNYQHHLITRITATNG